MLKLAILLRVLGASVSAPAVDLTGCNMGLDKTAQLNRRLTDWSAQWQKFWLAYNKWTGVCASADPQSPTFGNVERERRGLNAGAGALKTGGEGLAGELAKAKPDAGCPAVIARASEEMNQAVQKLTAAKAILQRHCQEPPPAPAD